MRFILLPHLNNHGVGLPGLPASLANYFQTKENLSQSFFFFFLLNDVLRKTDPSFAEEKVSPLWGPYGNF